jgi:hypothetical protein
MGYRGLLVSAECQHSPGELSHLSDSGSCLPNIFEASLKNHRFLTTLKLLGIPTLKKNRSSETAP